MVRKNALIFGASGTIGFSIYEKILSSGNYDIFTAGKSNNKQSKKHIFTNYDSEKINDSFINLPELEVIIWAQGLNCSDKISDFKFKDLNNLLNSNVIFIAACINNLSNLKKIKNGARLLIVSSIWQIESRKNKFSYTVSKSALQGLIKSSAIDLGEKNIIINAVLPGVIDSPMTRENLSEEQIDQVKKQTALERLPKPEDIANAAYFLVSENNKSITGQSLIVDCGFISSKSNL